MLCRYLGSLLIALAAGVATLATIAPDGNGPGVTCDELYHVAQGKRLVTALRQQGFEFFRPANIERNFDWQPGGPPVQAPLGHWILGWTHYLFDPAPDNPLALSITAARFAPAMAFALLVLIVGAWTVRREGPLIGPVAAAAVALTPRLFGHAHLAALDMLTTLFFVAALLAVAEAARGGRTWQYALAGVVWGAAMLVRLHGLLLGPPVILWLVWRSFYREPTSYRRWGWTTPLVAFPKFLIVWFVTGVATFVTGWPWLWLAPWERFHQYLASGTGRLAVRVFYAGQIWADRDVPWHYPWVMFVVTLPLGFLLLGLVGLWTGWRRAKACRASTVASRVPEKPVRHTSHRYTHVVYDSTDPQQHARSAEEDERPSDTLFRSEKFLLAGTMAFVLTIFSWPEIPVYDGVRLFLMVFPLWAIWVAIGAKRLIGPRAEREDHAKICNCQHGYPRFRTLVVVAFVILQGIGLIVYHPCQLSYYNALVGGLPGAARLGFEVTYWGDSVREPLLAEAARLSQDKPILFAPSLAPFQAPAITISSPALRQAGIALIGWDKSSFSDARNCRYAMIYHRRADLDDAKWILQSGRVVGEYSCQGVWLTRLIELGGTKEPVGP